MISTPHRWIPLARISPTRTSLARIALVVLLAVLGPIASPLLAQGPGAPVPAGVTEARRHEMRAGVRLSGTVEARRYSTVASEVAGLVVELAAREGDLVRRGEPLARLRRTHLELVLAARRADLAEAQARLELATSTLERRRELFDSDVVSRQTLDDAVSELAAWQGRAASLEAEIARVGDDLERSVVRAPFTGFVVEEHTQVGEWIATGGPVADVLDLEELEVVLEVPERYWSDLEEGLAARVTFDALPGHEIEGRVAAVIPRADRQARTFPVKVRFDNRDHRTAAGMLAQVDLPAGEPYAATVVPKDAVVRQGPRELVYRVSGEGTLEAVTVTTGAGAGQWIEVRGGVAPGDRVVTRGNERLFPGQAVAATPVEYEAPAP